MRIRRLLPLVLVSVIALAAAMVSRPGVMRVPVDLRESRARGGAEELQEQQEATDNRLEALRDARAAGLFRQAEPTSGAPAAGWVGEQLMNPRTDDWEPAVAADPNAPYVYILATRYGQPKPCSGNCPTPYIVLEISKDGGQTWSESKPLCACKGEGQYDPIIEVAPETGDVYALFMVGYNVVFVKSTDHGKTWSDPVPTWGKVSWNDKDVLTTSPNGKHVYVSWNGPQGGDPWVAQSHDYGETWTQTKLLERKRYFFAYDADVLPDGSVIFSEGSITYTAPGANPEGVVKQHAFISRDRGTTWENVVVDTVAVGEPCANCRADYYIGHSTLAADEDGDLAYAYDGATEEFGPQRIYVRTSSDGGSTWGPRTALSKVGENATSPAVEQSGDGYVRLWYMQTANGDDPDLWNVWYRSSTDGGLTWNAPLKISDATSGARYKTADGFMEPYGDYGEIDVTNRGKTIAVWGEGFSWIGPGGVWFNLQR